MAELCTEATTTSIPGPFHTAISHNSHPISPSALSSTKPADHNWNSALYFEKRNKTWFLFTNHVGLDNRGEYTDALWVYWSKDLVHWDPNKKAIVLDGQNCTWSSDCIGMPSVVQAGKRLAILYDAPGAKSVSHMKRDIGLAWLDLPLVVPE